MSLFRVTYHNKLIFATLFVLACCFWFYMILTVDSFETGESNVRIVKEESKRKRPNSWPDNSIPIRQTHSHGSFVSRTKRQARGNDGAEITKRSSEIQFAPALQYFYGYPQSINSYQVTGRWPFALPNYAQAQPGATFLQFQQQQQQQQQQPVMHVSAGVNDVTMQPVCFLQSQKNLPAVGMSTEPFYCTYVPVRPTYLFPEVPGITDFDRVLLESTNKNSNSEQHEFVATKFANPFHHLFKDYVRECPVNYLRCNDGFKCIERQKWCDNFVDCEDSSDESKCSCRERISKQRLCDYYQDCPHGEDELGCYGCPPNAFSCGDPVHSSKSCFTPEQRCDGKRQCAGGKDEENCSILTASYSAAPHNQMFPVGYSVGFLHKNLQGKWYPVCGHAHSWARDACLSQIGHTRAQPQIELIAAPNHQESGPFLTEHSYHNGKLVAECRSQVAFVRCPSVRSGTRMVESRINPEQQQDLVGVAQNSSFSPVVGIMGGHASLPRAWPFVIALNKNGHFHCGGAVLNEWWVLSAAHCFSDYQNQYYDIDAGMLRRFSFSPTRQTRRLDGVFVHPDYNPLTMTNDIALGLMSEPLFFNSWVRPVRLPDGVGGGLFGLLHEPSPGSMCTTVGWGATEEGGSDPDHLREVDVPITACKHGQDRNKGEICAGFKQGGRDACQGDSGGPLMCRVPKSPSEWYVGGIVSHGLGCGRRNEPGAYTKVSYFVDWINNIINSRDILSPVNRPLTVCPGFTCSRPFARCIPAKKRCNRVVDCLEADDEDNCSMPSTGDFIKILLGRENLSPTTTTTTTTATTRRPGN